MAQSLNKPLKTLLITPILRWFLCICTSQAGVKGDENGRPQVMSKMLLLEKTWDSSRVTSVENFASSWSHNVVVKFPEVECSRCKLHSVKGIET